MGGGVGGGERGGGRVVLGTFWSRAQNTEGFGAAVRATESAVESEGNATGFRGYPQRFRLVGAPFPIGDYRASRMRKVTLSLNEDAEKLCCFS